MTQTKGESPLNHTPVAPQVFGGCRLCYSEPLAACCPPLYLLAEAPGRFSLPELSSTYSFLNVYDNFPLSGVQTAWALQQVCAGLFLLFPSSPEVQTAWVLSQSAT